MPKIRLGQYKEAIADYRSGHPFATDDEALAYYRRGEGQFRFEHYQEAIADFDQAIHLRTHYVDAYISRGHAKTILGRYEEAIADFDQVIQWQSKNAYSYISRGEAKANLGQYEEAIADFDQAIQLRPDDSLTPTSVGAMPGPNLVNTRRPPLTLIRRTDCGRTTPAPTITSVGAKPRPTLVNTRRLLPTMIGPSNCGPTIPTPTSVGAMQSLGLVKTGRAIADYDQALRLEPDNASIYVNRGVANPALVKTGSDRRL